MANPDIPAALVVLQTHLVAAGAALTDDILDVDRGVLATRGRQIRYYWAGEIEPPLLPGNRSLSHELVGQRFMIVAAWPLSDLSEALITAVDTEAQLLAAEIRTRLAGDNSLGDHVTGLTLSYAEPDMLTIANARHLVVSWELDVAHVEYALAL